jgi:hypothetical protein
MPQPNTDSVTADGGRLGLCNARCWSAARGSLTVPVSGPVPATPPNDDVDVPHPP